MSDWEKLSKGQQEDVIAVRDRMSQHLIAETEAFYKQHPELRLSWSFTCDAIVRQVEPSITHIILQGLQTDGAHHKQWILWRIGELLGISHFLREIEDRGIEP